MCYPGLGYSDPCSAIRGRILDVLSGVGGTLIHVKLSVAGSWMLGKRRQENIREKTPPKRDVLKLMR